MTSEGVVEIDLRPLPVAAKVETDRGVGFNYDIPSPRNSKLLTIIVCLLLLLIAGFILGITVWMNFKFAVVENAVTSNVAVTTLRTTDPQLEMDLSNSSRSHNLTVPVPRMLLPPESPINLLQLPEVRIQPSRFCTSATSNSTSKTLLTIIMDPEDTTLRTDYRQIWSNYLDVIYGDLCFVMASSRLTAVQESVQAESEQYGDILQIRNFSNPATNYLKMLTALNWAAENCPHLFIVRMNVDVLIQPQSLKVVLDGLISSGFAEKPLIAGDMIQEESDSSAGVSSQFQNFVYGSFYIISKSALRPIVEGCRRTRPVSLEEVYITGTCASFANVQRINLGDWFDFEMERELRLWRKMFSCLPSHVLSVSNVGKDNVLVYWGKALRARCYLPADAG